MQTAFRSEEQFTQAQFHEWLREYGGLAKGRYELFGGRIVMTPPAGYPHGLVAATLLTALWTHVRARSLGHVFESSTGYELPSGDTLEPDVSFISTARFNAGPAPERGSFLRIVPDLVIEVLSDSTARRDRTEKKDIYATNGVGEYWLVDSGLREVSVLYRRGTRFDVPQPFTTGKVRSQVLPDLVVSVDDIFRDIA